MKQPIRKKSRRIKAKGAGGKLGVADLMMAVLDDAMATYKQGLTSPDPAKRIEGFRVETWVASDDEDWPFSFVNVCHSIGVSPDYVRSCMVRWRRKVVRDDDVVH